MSKAKTMKILPFKLGKSLKLECIPFSKLLNPEYAFNRTRFKKEESMDAIPLTNSRSLNTIKNQDIKALMGSIAVFGLLNPFAVGKLTNEMKKCFTVVIQIMPKVEYLIIDGQRRYKAIKELFQLKDGLERDKEEQERQNNGLPRDTRPQIEDFFLIPCIVYPYTKLYEARRHSIEDNKFSVCPKSIYLDHAERSDCGAFLEKEDFSTWEQLQKLRDSKQII